MKIVAKRQFLTLKNTVFGVWAGCFGSKAIKSTKINLYVNF